ncbi:MAG: hypothetical protein FWF46_06765 [Oscillospiraceae bacterium]|nr:hypothetical protein [Oscillospiraceae bacterium]
MKDPNDESALKKFLPWSKDFPDEIINLSVQMRVGSLGLYRARYKRNLNPNPNYTG